MRASLILLFLLGACGDGDAGGGLSRAEDERLNEAATMLDGEDARFEDREVDETFPEEDAGEAEAAEPGEAED